MPHDRHGMLHRPLLGRAISAVVIACFLGATTMCTSYQARSVVPDDRLPLHEKNIVILHQGGRTFQLTGARFSEDQLTGVVASSPSLDDASKQFELHLYLNGEYSLSLSTGQEITVPISAISTALVYDLNLRKTVVNTSILTTILTLVGLSAVSYVLAILAFIGSGGAGGSCPYVYVVDSDTSRFVGDIYPGAVQPSLERHDYLLLGPASPTGDEYCIRLANELNEVQHTNLAELVVCDHPPHTTLLADNDGRLHTVQQCLAPIEGMDSNGDPVLSDLLHRDDRPAAPQRMPASGSGLYSLFLKFARPPGAGTAKLVIRARNTPWLDYCYYRFQANFGSAFDGWQVRQRSATADELMRWRGEQGICLSASVKNGQRWESIGSFSEVGPLADREQVMVLDLGRTASDTVEVKLESGFLFWQVDLVGIDYSEDLPVTSTAVMLARAETRDMRDATPALRADDGEYYDQHRMGESALLRWHTPPRAQGMNRTVFLHTKGYYEVVREFSGEPDIALLQGFREPGAFSRYSCELFSALCQ